MRLWDFRRKGTFLEAIEDKPVLEAEVQIVLKWTIKIDLWFGLVAQGESALVEGSYIARGFDGVGDFHVAMIIDFLHHMHGGRIVEGRVGDGEDESPIRFEQSRQNTKQGFNIGHVE